MSKKHPLSERLCHGIFGRVHIRARAPRDADTIRTGGVDTVLGDAQRPWTGDQDNDYSIELDGRLVVCAPRKQAIARAFALPAVRAELEACQGRPAWVWRDRAHDGPGWTEPGWAVHHGEEAPNAASALAKAHEVKAPKRAKAKATKGRGFAFAWPPKPQTGKLSHEHMANDGAIIDWGWGKLAGPTDGSNVVRGALGPKPRTYEVKAYPCEIPRELAGLFPMANHLVFTMGHCVLVDTRARRGDEWAAWAPAKYAEEVGGMVFQIPPWDPQGYVVGKIGSEYGMLIALGAGWASGNYIDSGALEMARANLGAEV